MASAALYLKGTKVSFSDVLFKYAKTDLSALALSLKAVRENDDIQWSKFPLTHETAKTESAVDDLIFAWIRVKKISYCIDYDNLRSSAYLLSRISPKVRSADKKSWYETAARAFYSTERLTMNGHSLSKLVFQQLLDSYKKYTKGSFFSPLYGALRSRQELYHSPNGGTFRVGASQTAVVSCLRKRKEGRNEIKKEKKNK